MDRCGRGIGAINCSDLTQIDVAVSDILNDAATSERRLDVDACGLVVDHHVFEGHVDDAAGDFGADRDAVTAAGGDVPEEDVAGRAVVPTAKEVDAAFDGDGIVARG